MKYGEWSKHDHEVVREEVDKSGRKFVILWNGKSDLVITMRENHPKDNNFFFVKACSRKRADEIADRWMKSI